MKYEEQMIAHTLMSMEELLIAVKVNPDAYINFNEQISRLGDIAHKLWVDTYAAENVRDSINDLKEKALWFNNCDTAAMQAKIKISGL